MLKTGELLVERRRCPVVPNLPLARWCSRLHLDLARLGPAPPRSSRPCAFSLISALRLLAHLGHEPPRSSRPCASSLISALRLSSILQLIAEKTLRRISHALSAAPHPSRIPRMKLRTSCMRVFSFGRGIQSLSHLEQHAPSVLLCGRLLCSWCFSNVVYIELRRSKLASRACARGYSFRTPRAALLWAVW